MPADRRTVLIALAAAVANGWAGARIPALPGPALDPARWRLYKTRFLLPEGRIVDTGNGGVSHSEGQGFGLLFAAAAGDRPAFEAMLGWTERVLARGDTALFSWRYVPGAADPVPDPNDASDGDLLIAWALLCAGRKWSNPAWLRRSAEIRAAMARQLIVRMGERTLLLPGIEGFRQADRVTVNPSYYVWPALDAFAAMDGATWRPVIADGLRLLADSRFGPLALPADWVDVMEDGSCDLAADHPPRFGFEAVRIPAYMLMSGRRTGLGPIARFWATPANGQPLPAAWVDLVTGDTAPYALSPGGQAIAARLAGRPVPAAAPDGDYYSATLSILAALTATRA